MFCIKCGGKTEFVAIEGDELKRDRCTVCGYIHYHNPKIIAGILPIKNFDVLLCKRDIERSTKTFWKKKGHLLCSTCLDSIEKNTKKNKNL